MDVLSELKSRFRPALAALVDDPTDLLEMIRPAQDPKFGDYQANCAMPLGKQVKKPPREVAAEIVANVDLCDICDPPEIAGPGFINLRLKDDWIVNQLASIIDDDRLGVQPVAEPKTYVIDYSSPNVAKPMHVGHIRSTVIGDAIARTLRFLGHKVIGDNHLGDWGTQFGMIIYGYKHFVDQSAYEQAPVAELSRLYRHVNDLIEDAPEVGRAALAETAKLHEGDTENCDLWHEFLPHCRDEIQRVYDRLDIKFDVELGESFYHDQLASVVQQMQAEGFAEMSEGAVCVFMEEYEAPMIIQKSDGAYLYATTDLATIQYRIKTWEPDSILYVVDHRQSEHFEKLFVVARNWGFQHVNFQHVGFGTVLGKDGRPFKTRAGDTVGLEGLLDEAVSRALAVVIENDEKKSGGPELSREDRERIANVVGHAAIKYADLSHNRTSDYKFDEEKMVAMEGNTATYIQYSFARIQNIFVKGGVDIEQVRGNLLQIVLQEPAERALAVELLQFGQSLADCVEDHRPNKLTDYLFSLANRFSVFYDKCKVIKAETDELRKSRFLLCDLTGRTLKQGLSLLGISVVDKM